MTASSDASAAKNRDNGVFTAFDFPKPRASDVLAGVSVALILIPQSLAYATIAGMPPVVGLYCSAIPLLVFALFASSPYLQTGPVATTSLLTLAALTSAGFVSPTPAYVAAGTMVALMVGIIRIVFGLRKLGWVAYLISDPVMIGFTSAAAIIIMASQFPKCVGVSLLVPEDGGAISNAIWALGSPSLWSWPAISLSLLTVFLMVAGKKLHRLFPGVLLAVIVGFVASYYFSVGPLVGPIPAGLLNFSFTFPWSSMPNLVFASLVIAFVGFAEPSAIARLYANEDNTSWNANREFFSSGVANVASAFLGGYPVGGSFSRSSVNRVSGAKTRWSGAITGLCVLGFLSFAQILSTLPLAVLGGIVLAAVYRLTKPRRMLRLWQRSSKQAALAWTTFAATLISTPHIHWAVLLGVALSFAFHFGNKLTLKTTEIGEQAVTLRPEGLLWFASQQLFREQLRESANQQPTRDIKVDLGDLIALDVATIEAISDLARDIHPRKVTVTDSPWYTDDVVHAAIERATSHAAA